jgi:formylglycine-generating enzyme required for sulfatase activity
MKRLCLAALALALLACKKDTSVDVRDPGPAGTGAPDGNNSQTLPACSGGTSPGTHGPAMKHVGRLGGGCFWLDESEVTVEHYDQFLAGGPQNVAPCAGKNTSFAPGGGPGTSAPDLPVTGVDWCDAAAYCAWTGKRLCSTYDLSGAKKSEMESTCTDGDHDGFLYAQKFSLASGNCRGNTSSPAPVKSLASCVTPTGVFDLVGNVREWTAECDGTDYDKACAARGGAYTSTSAADWGCLTRITYPRDRAAPDLGFRCCADGA